MPIKEGTQEIPITDSKAKGKQAEELHTDDPLSEKDEVKQAEQDTQKQQNAGK